MTIRFQCTACQATLSAPDDKAGVSLKCPKCKAAVTIPAPVPPPPPPEDIPEVLPVPQTNIMDVQPVAPADPFAFDEGSPGSFNRGPRGKYADCPYCRCPGRADRVSFTWWGGLIGPAIFSHVQCRQCRRCYNGKSGKSNDTAIAIYFGVGLALGLGVLFLTVLARR